MFFSDYALAELVGPGMATWPKLDQVEKFPNILQTGTWEQFFLEGAAER